MYNSQPPSRTISPIQTVEANGIDIAFRIDGDRAPTKPWLVFAHALACDSSMWEPQVESFKRACNILRYDLRGHGRSSAPTQDYSLELLADDLRALLDVLRIPRCHLVGISLGGMVAQMMALRAPMRVSSLTLVSTASRHLGDANKTWDERIAAVRSSLGMNAVVPATLERWFTPNFRAEQPEVVANIGLLVRGTPVAGYIGCAKAISKLNLSGRLESIHCPVLVVAGTEDRGMPVVLQEELARVISGSKFERLAASHLLNVEQPEAFNTVLRNFLGSLS